MSSSRQSPPSASSSPIMTATRSGKKPKYRPSPSEEKEQFTLTPSPAAAPTQMNVARVQQIYSAVNGTTRGSPSPTLHPLPSPTKRIAAAGGSRRGEGALTSDESADDETSLAAKMRSEVTKAATSPKISSQKMRQASRNQPAAATQRAVAPRNHTRLRSLHDELEEVGEDFTQPNAREPAPPGIPSSLSLDAEPNSGNEQAADGPMSPDPAMEVLLAPMENSRAALEAEIERLQTLLSNTPARIAAAAVRQQVAKAAAASSEANVPASPSSAAPAAQPTASAKAASTISSSATRTPPRKSHYTRRAPPSITSIHSWMHDPQRTYQSAKQRVKERETTIRAYIAATTHLWVILLLRTALMQLQRLRGSNAVRSALSLPFVRSIIEVGSSISLTVLDWAVHTRLFHMLPGSGYVHTLLNDRELNEVWGNMPPLPAQEVLPLTQGPLRPLFVKLSKLPLSWLFFEIEQPPLVAVKEGAGAEGREGVPASPNSVASIAPSASPSAAAESAIVTSLLSRLESQAALIAFLQADRRSLQSEIRKLNEEHEQQLAQIDTQKKQEREEVDPAAQRQGLRNRRARGGALQAAQVQSVDIEPEELKEDAAPAPPAAPGPSSRIASQFPSAAASSSRSFMTAAVESRLNDLHAENIELRGLAGAQESSIQTQELTIQALTEETEVLAERIYELEEQLKEEQKKKGGGL